jgi:periplasmic copper chaperone A
MIRHRVLAAAMALGATLVGVFALAAPAAAHVTINPTEATQGSYGRFAFRVPNESDDASTVKLEVTLPADAPVASVSTQPVPGWTVAIERSTLATPIEVHGSSVTEAVSKITWTAAAGGGVKPGEFQEFPVSLGPLPEVDQMVFKALQTYSDGAVARWIEEPVNGQAAEQDPAPVLRLAPASSTDGPADASDDPAGASTPESSGSSSGLALGLGIAGLVAGLGGLVLGGLAYTRSRRT